ncbi:MAG TPA: ribonuclease III domain-containing protein [Candidatus Nanoarchaeia archaeon]|nr:ribonuclease III domain-containing protein [Candidatus Nanoarchaeia archaeon]
MNNIDYDPFLGKIETIIGYKFKNKRLGLSAITTRSYSNLHTKCPDNQALEFLGDAVLSLVSAELFYEKWSQLKYNEVFDDMTPESVMTKIRQEVVNNKYLAECADKYHLCDFIYHVQDNSSYICGSSGSDIIESLIAAIYLDNNKSILKAKEFILEFLDFSSLLENEEKLIEAVTRKNQKDMLIHKFQKLKRYTPNTDYPLIEDRFNPDDNTHHFLLGIRIDGILLPGITGEGTNKAEAEYQAAENAYKFLEKISWDLSIVS